MTRMERKAITKKRVYKMMNRVIFATALMTGGIMTSLLTGDGTALVIIAFFVAPLFFTNRKIFIK